MSDKQRNRSSRATKAKKPVDTASLQAYLDTLGLIRPTVHVNGSAHPTAVVTVDLGAPLNAPRLPQEQAQELITQVRRLTRDLYTNDVNVRVSIDTNNGICWSSVA